MNKHKTISFILPITSVLIIALFLIFAKPTTTGLTVLETDNANISEERTLEADVVLKTKEKEILPENTLIVVTINDKSASMNIKDFIFLCDKEYDYEFGRLESIDYEGYGFTGNHTYKLGISNFDLDLKIILGTHSLTTKIVFEDKILYENIESIIIS